MLRLDLRKTTVLTALFACAFALLLLPAAGADGKTRTLAPKKGKVYFGVTDTGETSGFFDFAEAVGKKPAVIQTFHPWGNSLKKALPRWREVRARPMLHITTKDDYGTELITPLQIANGLGDDYLIRLNRSLSENRVLTYIRPMGEPNRCKNPYAGVDCAGNIRGGSYSFEYYKSAFRRIAIITRGGGKRKKINRKLRAIGLPKIQLAGEAKAKGAKLPDTLPAAPVSIIWSPLPAGSPTVRHNFPGKYWPGREWADWVATDFYSKYTNWKHLKRFYVKWAEGQKKPMALTEWGVWDYDAPKFTKRIFGFVGKRPRMKMMVYYQDFGTSNPFRIQNFPLSLNVIRNRLQSPVFPRNAPRPPEDRPKITVPGVIPQ